MTKFVLNDETKINSYGFRVLNAGISLSRFLQNPVMLDEHQNSTASVIGRWKNITVTGHQLTAETDFDTNDIKSETIAGKVKRGFVKGASMGIVFDPKNMKLAKDGVYELTVCELYEASICAIPSNENALSLYAQDGKRLDESQIKLQLSFLKKLNSMDLLNALIELLGLPTESTEQNVIDAVKTLVEDKQATDTKKVEQMLDLAVSEFNLNATEKDFWRNAATRDFNTVEKILLDPSKKRIYLSKMVNNISKGEDRTKWSLDDYRKNAPKELEANPDLFNRLLLQEKIKDNQ